MSIDFHDPLEIFDFMLDVKKFANLWYKARNKTITDQEKKELEGVVRKHARYINLFLFRGYFISKLIKRGKILPRWIGIPDLMDRLIFLSTEYLTYKYDHVMWKLMDEDPDILFKYLDTKMTDKANGFIFEVLARKWLREVGGKHWSNVQQLYVITPYETYGSGKVSKHGKEIDAISIIRRPEKYEISIAEIKYTLTYHVGEFRDIYSEFAKGIYLALRYFGNTMKLPVEFREVTFISGDKLSNSQKNSIIDKLKKELYKIDKNILQKINEYKVYGIEDLEEKLLPA